MSTKKHRHKNKLERELINALQLNNKNSSNRLPARKLSGSNTKLIISKKKQYEAIKKYITTKRNKQHTYIEERRIKL